MSPPRIGIVLVFCAAFPSLARAQQEAKFVGWAADGSAVVEDISLGAKVSTSAGRK